MLKNTNHIKTSFRGSIFIPSICFIILNTLLSSVFPKQTSNILQSMQDFVFNNISWVFVICVSFFVFFMVFLAISKFGNIKLGPQDEKPTFGFFSWVAMLFAAGMGVGLMFFGVAEPLTHKINIISDKMPQREAMLHTIFHWGIHPWAIYGVMALSMAYFSFRHNMPLTIRSTFFPILKDKINGFWGNIIDILALIATVFGITTTLGYSASQLNAGLSVIGILDDISFSWQLCIIILIVFLSTLSSISGVGKGVKILSELNLFLAIFLMLFILAFSPTNEILSKFSSNLGYYLSKIVNLSFKTYEYDRQNLSWFHSWTIFYWAWWLSWAPFVGYFIAKISRGRTIREFIFGVLIIPTSFNIFWFSVFGNSALNIDALNNGKLSSLVHIPEKLLFEFLNYFPFSNFTSILAIFILTLFFITSADSGILVLNIIASGGKDKSIKWQNILWGITLIVLAGSLLYSGGLKAISSMTLLVAMPFMLFMLAMCLSLFKGLKIDDEYFYTGFTKASVFWSGEFWEQRLEMIMLQPSKKDTQIFMKNTVLQAMNKLKEKLVTTYNLNASIQEDKKSIKLIIEKELAKDFIYGVEIVKKQVGNNLINDNKLPNIYKKYIYEPMTFFNDGRIGYEIRYMNTNEVIADILKQYERYLSLLDNEDNDLMLSELNDDD